MHSVELSRRDILAVGLHPTAGPVRLASTQRVLEVCQADLSHFAVDPTGGSWPSVAGFDACRPFDNSGNIALPSTGSDAFHVAFAVRPRGRDKVKVKRLTITYEAVDQYFEVATPSLRAGKRGPRVVIVPSQSTIVAAQPVAVVPKEQTNALRAEVEQRGRKLKALDTDPRLNGQPYGPATLGQPVTIRVENRSRRSLRPALLMEWG